MAKHRLNLDITKLSMLIISNIEIFHDQLEINFEGKKSTVKVKFGNMKN